MSDAETLLTILANQRDRTAAALEGLDSAVYRQEPGGGCKSIAAIGAHLLALRRFQLSLLGSPRASRVADDSAAATVDELLAALDAAADEVAAAVSEHDPDGWRAVPDAPREGLWGELPTLDRFVRPFNDFVNHLGAIRAIRRIHGSPAERTQ